MKHLFLAAVLLLVGVAGWRIGGTLSGDAMGMAVGMLLGIMAGIPTALLVLASERKGYELRRQQEPMRRYPQIDVQPPAAPQIVHNHVHYHGAPSARDSVRIYPDRTRLQDIQARHQAQIPQER